MASREDVTALREVCGLTQVDFAEIMGVSLDTVKSWELGRRNAPAKALEVLERLADIKHWYAVRQFEIMSGDPEPMIAYFRSDKPATDEDEAFSDYGIPAPIGFVNAVSLEVWERLREIGKPAKFV